MDVTPAIHEQEGDGLPSLQPIAAPRKLAADAADALREQILSGNLHHGTHLVEAKLAARLGVSRGTVREAIKILTADGLVREEPRRGAYVASLSRGDVREIYDVRAAVEGRAAHLLAQRRDPTLLAALAASIDAIARAAAAGDMATLRREDLGFHARICELSGNARLVEIFNRYVPIVQTLLAYDQLVYASPADIADEHRVIFQAISDGDAAGAALAVQEHCDRSGAMVAAYFADEPGL
jgi:DNA-binding GntR family transcriptional regulator